MPHYRTRPVDQQRAQVGVSSLLMRAVVLYRRWSSDEALAPAKRQNCRPFLKVFASLTLATSALAVSGPTPESFANAG